MMLPLQDILNKYNVHPKGIISVGTHWAEEHNEFIKCGIERFVYIEPCKPAMEILESRFKNDLNVQLFQVACGDKEESAPMYISHQNQGQSNSLLKPELHLEQHPEVVFDDAEAVEVIQLDNLPIRKDFYSFLYMDVQGAEGLVLKGAGETLKHIDFIMTECNKGQTYSGNMEIVEMDKFLGDRGFVRVETYWPSPNWTWGDCVYIRQSLFNE